MLFVEFQFDKIPLICAFSVFAFYKTFETASCFCLLENLCNKLLKIFFTGFCVSFVTFVVKLFLKFTKENKTAIQKIRL